MEIIYKSPSELKPFQKNPYNHPEKQLTMLKKSMREFGFTSPILISQDNMVIAGHARLKAAQEIGLSEVPTIFIDLPYEKAVAYVIADNQLAKLAEEDRDLLGELLEGALGIPDFDIEAVGFSSEDIDSLLKSDEVGEVVEDEFNPDEEVETRCKEGDLWQLGRHRLLCGDSTKKEDVERLMNGESAELLFTSPPYSDMRDYNGDKDLSVDHLSDFINVYSDFADYQVINLGLKRANNEVVPYWDEYIKKAQDSGYKFLSWNIWKKPNAGSIANQTAMFPIEHEWLFVFGENVKKLNKTIKNKTAGKVSKRHYRKADGTIINGELRTRHNKRPIGSVIELCQEVNKELNQHHPAIFPIELPSKYIEAMTDQNDNVIEPFCGSGTTLIACEQLNRNCFAMELDPHYCDVILSRWEQFTNQTAKKLN